MKEKELMSISVDDDKIYIALPTEQSDLEDLVLGMCSIAKKNAQWESVMMAAPVHYIASITDDKMRARMVRQFNDLVEQYNKVYKEAERWEQTVS